MSTTKPDLTRIWAEGSPSAVIDPDVNPGGGKFNEGWTAEKPSYQNFNFLQQLFTQGLAHINEQGIAVWDAPTTYPIGGVAKGSDGNIYIAVLEQGGNDPVSDDGTNWTLWYSNYSDVKSGRKNFIINGDFRSWQRGTSLIGVSSDYAVDRWGIGNGVQNVVRSSSNPDDNFFSYSAQVTQTFAGASPQIRQPIELDEPGSRSQFILNTPYTLSFWARGTSGTNVEIAIDWSVGLNGNSSILGLTNIGTHDGNWKKFEYTFNITAGPTSGSVNALGITINISDEILGIANITGVQLEKGSVATDFEYRSIAEELSLCQRYFYALKSTNTFYNFGNITSVTGSTDNRLQIKFPTTMRVTPTFTSSGGFAILGPPTFSSVGSVDDSNPESMSLRVITTAAVTAGESYLLRDAGNGDAIMNFDAEL